MKALVVLGTMSAFDYLTILTSIVLGLSIANVLGRLAIVIAARERVDFYWPPVAWGIWLFFIAVQHWWAQWSVRHTAVWSFGTFWLELLVPVVLFILAALVLPERESASGKIDLARWFFHNRAWFFGFMFFLPALSLGEELSRTGRISSMLNLAFLLLFEAVIAVAFFVKSRRALEWITAQAMVLTVVYVWLLYVQLPG
ncbi:MAG TPA: hypothetical protein VGX91_08800 [Candidatus Cybelea sp.]|jgi:hypothetical protein|nr:hypothetical protein [Candidatus Cybelea sp.]